MAQEIKKKDLESLIDISLKTFDEKIYNLFNNKIHVVENNNKKMVHVLLSTPERWNMMKKHNAIIDNNKNPILPIIFITRTSIDSTIDRRLFKNDELVTYQKLYDYNNSIYHNNPIYKIIKSPAPVFININYEIKISTRYMTSINSVIEQIILNYNRFELGNASGVLESFSSDSNVTDFSEDIRIISSTMNFNVNGYIWNKDKVTQESSINKTVLTINEKTI
jgi:hypothetical protein